MQLEITGNGVYPLDGFSAGVLDLRPSDPRDGVPQAAVTVEHSTDGGATWRTYSQLSNQRRGRNNWINTEGIPLRLVVTGFVKPFVVANIAPTEFPRDWAGL